MMTGERMPSGGTARAHRLERPEGRSEAAATTRILRCHEPLPNYFLLVNGEGGSKKSMPRTVCSFDFDGRSVKLYRLKSRTRLQ